MFRHWRCPRASWHERRHARHAWLKTLAQTSKGVDVPSFAPASDLGSVQPAFGPGGSWLIRARGRAAPMVSTPL
jgi:hypothetical protein